VDAGWADLLVRALRAFADKEIFLGIDKMLSINGAYCKTAFIAAGAEVALEVALLSYFSTKSEIDMRSYHYHDGQRVKKSCANSLEILREGKVEA